LSRFAENERIVLSEEAFTEFLAAIFGEPEKPSDKLLSAVKAYKSHEPIKSQRYQTDTEIVSV
jgi:uncharacterized protein (DUF1778 family)